MFNLTSCSCMYQLRIHINLSKRRLLCFQSPIVASETGDCPETESPSHKRTRLAPVIKGTRNYGADPWASAKQDIAR